MGGARIRGPSSGPCSVGLPFSFPNSGLGMLFSGELRSPLHPCPRNRVAVEGVRGRGASVPLSAHQGNGVPQKRTFPNWSLGTRGGTKRHTEDTEEEGGVETWAEHASVADRRVLVRLASPSRSQTPVWECSSLGNSVPFFAAAPSQQSCRQGVRGRGASVPSSAHQGNGVPQKRTFPNRSLGTSPHALPRTTQHVNRSYLRSRGGNEKGKTIEWRLAPVKRSTL